MSTLVETPSGSRRPSSVRSMTSARAAARCCASVSRISVAQRAQALGQRRPASRRARAPRASAAPAPARRPGSGTPPLPDALDGEHAGREMAQDHVVVDAHPVELARGAPRGPRACAAPARPRIPASTPTIARNATSSAGRGSVPSTGLPADAPSQLPRSTAGPRTRAHAPSAREEPARHAARAARRRSRPARRTARTGCRARR